VSDVADVQAGEVVAEPGVGLDPQRDECGRERRVRQAGYAESAGYLPMVRDAYSRGSLTQVVRDAWEQRGRFDLRSTKFWDRIQTLVRAMRNGDEGLGVPPYREGRASGRRM
jgi:hypothetical protein